MTKMLIILNRNLVETFDIYHRGQCLIYGGTTMPLLVRKQAGIASISVSKLSSATSWLSETDMFFQSAPLACSTSCFCVASVLTLEPAFDSVTSMIDILHSNLQTERPIGQ